MLKNMEKMDKNGFFYLGKKLDKLGNVENDRLNYEAKDLTTHAVCIGMTGSGKTGLGIALLEEAGLNKIPSLIIDPKGDLTNLYLTFPNLAPSDFLPWIDKADADRKGISSDEFAKQTAEAWKKGLEEWNEEGKRIQALRDAVDILIYTPASKAGIPISILSSFKAPSKEILSDESALRDRILSTTSSLLGLLGINADPIKSREHILISTLLNNGWKEEKDLDIETLINQVQKPPFSKIGVLDIETFFPAKDRLQLSISLNNLLASPGFKAWIDGEPLDIQKLLYSPTGKPRLAILSIAHLSDSERMFFVTLLLNELIAWMRRASGSSSLRTILYMDEIFGYFPPTANPPSKLPMLTLLKQARAFGVGIFLSTQNPVDLDYKGLSNCGTWFIGKLQTERDKSRVLEGLKIASNGEIDNSTLNTLIAATKNRRFIMRSIHEKEPIIFETRWTLSFLRGPLTLSQIGSLKEKSDLSTTPAIEKKEKLLGKPSTPSGIEEFFLKNKLNRAYSPCLGGFAKIHFTDPKNKIDEWQELLKIYPVSDNNIQWDRGEEIQKEAIEKSAASENFEELPQLLSQAKNYTTISKEFSLNLFQTRSLTLYRSSELNLTSTIGETEQEFKNRCALTSSTKQNGAFDKVKAKYQSKIESLTQKLKQKQSKLAIKSEKSTYQKADTLISFGTTLLGALFGKKITKGTLTQAGSSMKKVGKISSDSQEKQLLEAECNDIQKQIDELQSSMNSEMGSLSVNSIQIDTLTIKPKKGDIYVDKVALIWK